MRLEFRHECPSLPATMRFERLFEGELQMTEEDRNELNENCISSSTWLYVDGKLAGEQVLVSCMDFLPGEWDEWDLPELNALKGIKATYVYSTALLPAYQGRGLGRLLTTYVLGRVWGAEIYEVICGHATTPSMCAIRHELGAVFGLEHEDWFGSGRIASYYEHSL